MSYRIQKVNSLLERQLNIILLQKVDDVRIKSSVVTEVSVSKDLRNAKVFIGSTGDDIHDKKVIKALNEAKGYIQREMSRAVFLKYTPDLKFYGDKTNINAERIENIIEQWHKDEKSE